jgi:leucyl aminopeptidase
MMPKNDEIRPIEEPLAELERHLIAAYLAGTGDDFHSLMARNDEAARQLLAEASRYASERLSEIESRSHYLQKLHGSE